MPSPTISLTGSLLVPVVPSSHWSSGLPPLCSSRIPLPIPCPTIAPTISHNPPAIPITERILSTSTTPTLHSAPTMNPTATGQGDLLMLQIRLVSSPCLQKKCGGTLLMSSSFPPNLTNGPEFIPHSPTPSKCGQQSPDNFLITASHYQEWLTGLSFDPAPLFPYRQVSAAVTSKGSQKTNIAWIPKGQSSHQTLVIQLTVTQSRPAYSHQPGALITIQALLLPSPNEMRLDPVSPLEKLTSPKKHKLGILDGSPRKPLGVLPHAPTCNPCLDPPKP
ncbi:hypothetical protein PCANC_25092 [Puccinia coronata f. sp. avenae]|uniref:Uncharacterized protein n=1 Tax=Puccinia coronata f. sp. avenae TaxID=200324 RepID=A0A2N5TAR6_9BASI|nr:hypothetical protein PCANC_25092 [Puccinia coronata f. sp. avenae]